MEQDNRQLQQQNSAIAALRQWSNIAETERGLNLQISFSGLTDSSGSIIRLLPEEMARARCISFFTYNNSTPKKFCGKKYEQYIMTPMSKTKAPSLATISDAFGEECALEILEKNIQVLNEVCGSGRKLEPFQITTTACALMAKFSGEKDLADRLTINEILLFFFKVISGEYGSFYGGVDPLMIGSWAEKFLEWRYHEIDVILAKQKWMDRVAKSEKEKTEFELPDREEMQKLIARFGGSTRKTAPETEEEKQRRKENEEKFLLLLTPEQREEYIKSRILAVEKEKQTKVQE